MSLPEKVAHVAAMPKTADENIAAAKALKEEGNARFKAGDFANARKCYAKMTLYTKHLDSEGGGSEMAGIGGMFGQKEGGNPADKITPEQKAEVASLVNAMNSNLSNCFLKLEKYQSAVEKASLVLARDPSNKKILFRRGKAYYLLKDIDRARADLTQCDPADKEVAKVLAACDALEKKLEKAQKRKLAGMFDKMGHDERSNQPPASEGHGHGHGHAGHGDAHGHSHGGEPFTGHGDVDPVGEGHGGGHGKQKNTQLSRYDHLTPT